MGSGRVEAAQCFTDIAEVCLLRKTESSSASWIFYFLHSNFSIHFFHACVKREMINHSATESSVSLLESCPSLSGTANRENLCSLIMASYKNVLFYQLCYFEIIFMSDIITFIPELKIIFMSHIITLIPE